MSSFTSRQWLAVVVGFLLFVALFFVNKKAPLLQSSAVSGKSSEAEVKDFQQILKESEESMNTSDKVLIDRLLNALNNSADSLHTKVLFRLSTAYDSIGQPLAASFYLEQLAKLDNSPIVWYKTGERYLDITELVEPSDKMTLLTKAEDCFNNVLKIDSNNLDAKVGIGSCIVEQGNNPMMGIKMISEVINKDSNNISAQIALGKFSIKSGQFAKAIYRFHRVMQIDNSFKKGYLYLAQAYEGLGNNKDAIVNLKKYRTFAPDSSMKAQIDKHISEDLKGDTTN